MSKTESNARSEKIDLAVSKASELIGALMAMGPINPAQARLIMTAAVRATVSNYQDFEIKESAQRIAADLERVQK